MYSQATPGRLNVCCTGCYEINCIGSESMGQWGLSPTDYESHGGIAPIDLRPTYTSLFILRTITSAPSLAYCT